MKVMTSAERSAVATRRAQVDSFYAGLMPVLVGFAEQLGITPAHAVLTDAAAFAPPIGAALRGVVLWATSKGDLFVSKMVTQTDQFTGVTTSSHMWPPTGDFRVFTPGKGKP